MQQKLRTPRPLVAALSVSAGAGLTFVTAEMWIAAFVAFAAAVIIGVANRNKLQLAERASTEEIRSGDYPRIAYIAPLVAVAVSIPTTSTLLDVTTLPLSLLLTGSWAVQSTLFGLIWTRQESLSQRIGMRRRRKILERPDHPEVKAEQVAAVKAYTPVVRTLCRVGAIDGVAIDKPALCELMELDADALHQPLADLRSTGVITDGGLTRPHAVTLSPEGVLAVEEARQSLRGNLIGGSALGAADSRLHNRAIEDK